MPGSNPGTLTPVTTPWSLDFLQDNNAGQGLDDLGFSAYMKTLPSAADATALGVLTKWPVKHTSDYGNDIDAMIAALGAGPYTVHVDADSICSGNTTCGPLIHFIFEPDCEIGVNNGITLTIASPEHVHCPVRQKAFTLAGTGLVAFTRGGTGFPGWWGAVADGATDDTAAINACIKALGVAGGGTVRFPTGVYRVAKPDAFETAVRVLYDHMLLCGEGPGSVIYCTEADTNIISVAKSANPAVYVTRIEDVIIRDLKVLGGAGTIPGGQDKGDGVRVTYARDCKVLNVQTQDVTHIGIISIYGGHEILIDGCRVLNSGFAGIVSSGISNWAVQINACVVRSTYGATLDNIGIQVSGQSSVTGCFVYDCDGTGISVGEGASVTTVTGNTVIACGASGCWVYGSSGGGPTYHGIATTITGNVFICNSLSGVNVEPDTVGTVIIGNTFIDNYPYDIAIASPCTVQGNVCKYIDDFQPPDGFDLALEDGPVVYPTCIKAEAAIYVAALAARSVIAGNQLYGMTRGIQYLTRDITLRGNDLYLMDLGNYRDDTVGKFYLVHDEPVAPLTVYAAGTGYDLTATPAALDFATTDPVLTIATQGTWRLSARVTLKYEACTLAASQVCTFLLRRTNNTPADLAASVTAPTIRSITAGDYTILVVELPETIYTTDNLNDVLTIFGSIAVVPAAGSLRISEAHIVATRVS